MNPFSLKPTTRRRFFRRTFFSTLALGLVGKTQAGETPEPLPDNIRERPSSTTTGSAVPHKASPSPSPSFGAAFERFKKTASDTDLYRFLYSMPKGADLHHHLGGGFLPQRWFALATDPTRNGGQRFYTRYRLTAPPSAFQPGWDTAHNLFFWMTLHENAYRALPKAARADFKPMEDLTDKEKAAWISSVVLDREGEGRDEFFEYTWSRLNHLLFSIHVSAELVVENMKTFGAEGVRYLELMTFYHLWRNENGEVMPAEAAKAFWQERLSRPDAVATGVKVRFKAVVLRFADDAIEQTRRHFDYVHNNRDLWVGIDMAGREDDNRGFPKRFTRVFDDMLRKYPKVPISIHAGEAEKPDSHIFDTLRLGATRIGHGINLIQDPTTFQSMRHGRFLIEINLISNHLLGYVPDTADHPFPVYFRQGIPCCLNTDDRGMWDSNMTDEYFVAVKHFDLSWQELCELSRNSLSHAFLEPAEKAALLSDFERALARFEAQLDFETVSQLPAETYGYGRRYLGLTPLAPSVPSRGPMPIVRGLSAV